MARFIIWLIIFLIIHPGLALVYSVCEVLYMLYLIGEDERRYRKPPTLR